MLRSINSCRWGGLLLAICVAHSITAAELSLPPPQQLSAHVWAWIGPYDAPSKANGGYRMNLAFVVGEERIAVFDSGYGPAMAKAMLAHIRAISDRPVAYVINTNSQPHRIMGNPTFKAQGATIIAAADAVERMVQEGADFAATIERVLELPVGSVPAPGKPDRTIQELTPLDLGGLEIQVQPVGRAHTDGSLVVHVPSDKIVYAGDVLYGGRLLALLPVSGLETWMKAFDALRAFDDATMIPGHGQPAPLAAFEHPTYRYLAALKTHMDAAADAGDFMQDAINSLDDSAWSELVNYEDLAGRNAHEAYRKQEAAAFGM